MATNSAGRPNSPRRPAAAVAPRTRVRPASVTTITVRVLHPSTQAPTNSERNRTGACPTARRRPSWPAPACSVRTAKSGRTVRAVCSPSWEAVWPTQNLRNSRSRQRPRGTRRTDTGTAEEGEGTEIPRIADGEARRPAHTWCARDPGRGRLALPHPQGQHAMTGRSRPRRQRALGRPGMSPLLMSTRCPHPNPRRVSRKADFRRGEHGDGLSPEQGGSGVRRVKRVCRR